jgi:myosin heavy subunit
VFQKEMDILKEDGLEEQLVGLVPPSNDLLISLISGKLSLFSIINDMTLPQFKDEDIMHGFQKLESPNLTFHKLKNKLFTISHSPCSVTYSIEGFKPKNHDKINQDILTLVETLWSSSKEMSGKTILSKFSKQMDDLMV